MKSDADASLAQRIALSLSQFKRIEWRPDVCREIKKSEFMMMAIINYAMASGKDIKVSELSTHMEITPAAVTHMINSLEEGGFVQRLSDPSDRRIVLVKLTDKGNSTVRMMKKEFLKVFEQLVDYLGEEDSNELARILELSTKFIKERKG